MIEILFDDAVTLSNDVVVAAIASFSGAECRLCGIELTFASYKGIRIIHYTAHGV